jgi:heme/copper-type cytochrome/quinol oxidase subunit 2
MGAALYLANAAEEGKDVVLSMLAVGLVFLAVIGIGEFVDWRARSRHRAH